MDVRYACCWDENSTAVSCWVGEGSKAPGVDQSVRAVAVVPWPAARAREAQSLVEGDRSLIAGAHLEMADRDARPAEAFQPAFDQGAGQPAAALPGFHGEAQDLGFTAAVPEGHVSRREHPLAGRGEEDRL